MIMSVKCRDLFIICQSAWMLSTLVVLSAGGRLSVESYFIASFIGLLGVMQVSAPTGEQPDWWRTLKVIEAVCFLIFGYILYEQIIVTL